MEKIHFTGKCCFIPTFLEILPSTLQFSTFRDILWKGKMGKLSTVIEIDGPVVEYSWYIERPFYSATCGVPDTRYI